MALWVWRWQITGQVVRGDRAESIQVDNERFAPAAQEIVCSVWCACISVGVCVCVFVCE